jgi:hypothetical protein
MSPRHRSGMVMRQCKNCDGPIGNLERAFAWEGSIICGPCHAKLTAPHVVGSDQVFDSLEDLAKSTQRKSQPATNVKITPLLEKSGTELIRVFLVLGIVTVVIVIGYAVEYWRQGVSGIIVINHGAATASFNSPSDPSQTIDPQFTISQQGYSGDGIADGAGWEVTNESQSPLTISRFNINGEFDSPIAISFGTGSIVIDHSRSLPLTLSIGESVLFLQWTLAASSSADPQYSKQEIFIDIDTDRGNFRYQNFGFQKR